MVCTIEKMSVWSWRYYLGLLRYYFGRRRRRPGDDDDDDESGGGTGLDEAPDFDAQSLPGEPPGLWMGNACRALGVYGAIWGTESDEQDIRRLYEGFHPKTGMKLVQNAGRMEGKRKRTPGWDMTFSAPKSVSVYYCSAPRWLRDILDQIQEDAVRWALKQAEDRFAVSRVGRNGQHVPVDIVAATFPHHASRANESQIHTHCTIVNLGRDEAGKYRALYSSTLFANRDLLGSIYRARLAWLLQTRLGLELEKDGFSFRIKGVPQELCDAHSTRRTEIEKQLDEYAEAHGVAVNGKTAAVAALTTRAKKDKTVSLNELLVKWQKMSERYGFTAEKAVGLLFRYKAASDGREAKASVEEAIQCLTAKGNHFSDRKFFEEVLNAGAPRNVADSVLLEVAPKYLQEGHVTFLGVPPHDTTGLYTTKEILEEERRLLDATHALRRSKPRRRVTSRIVDKVCAKRKTITPEQREAVRHLLQAPGSFRLAEGAAGTGKTSYVVEPVAAAFEKAGYNVVAATPTGKTARVLESETGIDTDTITMRLVDFNVSFGWRDLKHHLRMFARVVKGRGTWPMTKPKPIKIAPRTVLIVDESGMVNTRHMRMIAERVARGGGILIMIGDPSQLTPIVGMSPFQSLCTRFGAAHVRKIKRQKEEWARKASMLFAEGKCGKALKMYADRGLLRLSETKELAMKHMLADWAEIGIRRPEDVAILVATNTEAEIANDMAQKARMEAGYLRKKSVFVRDVTEKRTYKSFVHVGDRVVFTQNSKYKYKVQNGTFGTVQRIKGRRTLVVRVPDIKTGRPVLREINAKDFPHIRRGYATTTHKFQGDSVKNSLCLVGGRMQDQPLTYVQASRAKWQCAFYASKMLVPDLAQVETSPLAYQMERRPNLAMASDILEELGGRELNREAVTSKLLDVWEETTQAGEHCVIIAPTFTEAIELNRCCQQRRIQGAVRRGTKRVSFDGQTFVVGDRIRFRSACFRLRASKGDFATVVDVDVAKKTLELQLDWVGPGVTKTVNASLAEHGHFIGHGWVFTNRQEKGLNGEKRIYWDSFFRDHFWELRRHTAKHTESEAEPAGGKAKQEHTRGTNGQENNGKKRGTQESLDRLLVVKQSASELRSRRKAVKEDAATNEREKLRQRRQLQANLLERWKGELQAERRRIRAGLPVQQNLYPALSDWALSLQLDGNDREWEALEAKIEEAITNTLDNKHRERSPENQPPRDTEVVSRRKVEQAERTTQRNKRTRRVSKRRHWSVEQQAHYETLLSKYAQRRRLRWIGNAESRKAELFEEECRTQAEAYHQGKIAADHQAELEQSVAHAKQAEYREDTCVMQRDGLEPLLRVAAERKRREEEERRARAKAQAEEARQAAAAAEQERMKEAERQTQLKARAEEAERVAAAKEARRRFREQLLKPIQWSMWSVGAVVRGAIYVAETPYRRHLENVRLEKKRIEREERDEEASRRRQQKQWQEEREEKRLKEEQLRTSLGEDGWREYMENQRRDLTTMVYERLSGRGTGPWWADAREDLLERVERLDASGSQSSYDTLWKTITLATKHCRHRENRQSDDTTHQGGTSDSGSACYSSHSSDYDTLGSSRPSQVDEQATRTIPDYTSQLSEENASFQQSLQNGAAGAQAAQQTGPTSYTQIRSV